MTPQRRPHYLTLTRRQRLAYALVYWGYIGALAWFAVWAVTR